MTVTELNPNLSVEVRSYGGWRRTRGIGLFGLGEAGTVVVIGAMVAVLAAASINLRLLVLFGPMAAAVVFGTVVRRDGESLGEIALRRGRWWWGTLHGYHHLRCGTVTEAPGAWDLPGPLAATKLLSAEDGLGGRFGLVWDQRSGYLTATLTCTALSTWLVDGDQSDGWVSNWHAWLAGLGYEPTVAWVAVTVDSAPEPGSTLTDYVAGRLDPAAPEYARCVMAELVRHSPAAAADVQTRVSITFDPSASPEPLDDLADQAGEVSRLLTGMASALAECGVGNIERAQDWELAGIVRTAFDPAARGEVQHLHAPGPGPDLLRWDEAGPTGHVEEWRQYIHDSGVSVVWGWHEAPRQRVTSNVLARLMTPGRFPKRVTLQYRPYSAAAAAEELERQVNAAAFREAIRRAQGRDETARDAADRGQAVQAAREEAIGAGLVRVSCYVTVTATDPADLATAVAEVEARAGQSKIKLRRLAGSQLAGFCATLPGGVHPAHLAKRGRR
jgi:hypothetical protein